MLMRFRILHLIILTLLVAAVLGAVERASFRTVNIVFSDPEAIVPAPPIVLPSFPDEEVVVPPWDSTPKEYSLVFYVMESEQQKFRTVSDEFGFNQLIGMDIQLDNVTDVDGCVRAIRYRRYALPWASAETIDGVVGRHFNELTPHVDYWHQRSDDESVHFW